MQVHNGIRPQDILVLLKLLLEKGKGETLASRSKSLGLSLAEISKSIQRSRYSGLISYEEKVATHTFLDFLKYGLSYTFPVKPGAPTRGIPTAISHPWLQSHFPGNELFVWPHAMGTVRGLAIAPLYESLPEVVTLDEPFYYATALVEVFRTGKTREKQYAEQELKSLFEVERTFH